MPKKSQKLGKTKRKIKFWDILIFSMIALFVIALVFSFALDLTNDTISYILGIAFVISGILELCLRFGMTYYAFKMKRGGWGVVVLFLGTIFSLIFYFSILRKDLESH